MTFLATEWGHGWIINLTGWLLSSGKETGLRRQHVSGSIHLLRETKSQLSWSPNTDMSLCFRAHLNIQREGLSVGCTSPWELVRASLWAWDTPRLTNKQKKKKKMTFLATEWGHGWIINSLALYLCFLCTKKSMKLWEAVCKYTYLCLLVQSQATVISFTPLSAMKLTRFCKKIISRLMLSGMSTDVLF